MMNFKNTKMAKVISGFVGLSTAVMMMGPAVASAATVEELTAQINALLAQVTALQAASTTSAPVMMTGSHVFSVDLTVGSKGADVVALQEILVAKGHLVMPAGVAMGYFGNATKAAVMKWQASAGIAPAAGYVGPKSRAALNGMSSMTTTPTTSTGFPAGCTSAVGYSSTTGVSCASVTAGVPSGTGVSVVLDMSSPAAKSIIAGATTQGVTTLAAFKISNGGAAAKVTMMKFKRTGVSSDATLNNVYLYDSMGNRLTDAASVSAGNISFTDAAGLVSVPAMSSVVVVVRGDFAVNQNGQTIGIMFSEATADAGTVTGLPVSAAEHTLVSSPSGMTTFSFGAATTPTGGTIDPQVDYVVWQNTVTVGSRDANLSSMRFQQIGSVYATDVTNLRLMIDGVQVGTAVAQADANRFVTFNFATPVAVKAGSHVVKMLGDIVGGSNRNFEFSIRRVVDTEVWDSQLNVSVAPMVNNAAFVAVDGGGTVAINVGTLTVSKDTSSPSGNVVKNGSALTLAKFKMKAQGESLKIENLRVSFTSTNGAVGSLRNGAIFLNGVQVGSTATLNEDSQVTPYTQFNLGSSMVLLPGVDNVVEVRADVFDNDGTDSLVSGDVLTVNLVVGSSNVYRMSSLSYTTNAAVSANPITAATGAMTLAKYTAYAAQTVTVPQTAYKIGEYRLTTGSTEGVNVDTLSLDFTGSSDVTKLQSVYVVYGSKTTATKATVSSTTNTFSINEAIAANSTLNVAVYATLPATQNSADVVVSLLTVSGTSVSSGSAVTSAQITGQTITVGAGTLSLAVDASTPVAALVVANSMPKVASYKFTGLNDSFTVTELVATTTNASGVVELVFKDGATELMRKSFDGLVATATGLTIAVPYNSTKVIDVYANLGSIGTGFGSTGSNVGVALVAYEKMTSNGVKTRVYLQGTSAQGNNFYAYKTKPTITNVALPTTVLTNGSMTVAKVSVTADAGGTVAWRKISFAVATTSVVATNFRIYESGAESSVLTGTAAVTGPNNSGYVVFTSTSDQEVSGTKTYVVKADVTGADATGDTITTSIPSSSLTFAAPAAYATVAALTGTFVWSDEAILGHDATTLDWNNDYLVKNIPTDSQALTK